MSTQLEERLNRLENDIFKIKKVLKIDEEKLKIKDLDLVMIIRDACPWCNKMIETLRDADELKHVKVYNYGSKEADVELESFRSNVIRSDHPGSRWLKLGEETCVHAVPLIMSKKLGTHVIGYKSIEELIALLSVS
jgi:hypothetical protein